MVDNALNLAVMVQAQHFQVGREARNNSKRLSGIFMLLNGNKHMRRRVVERFQYVVVEIVEHAAHPRQCASRSRLGANHRPMLRYQPERAPKHIALHTFNINFQ